VEGFGKEGEGTVRDDQTVAEMANEVLMRQAKARADRGGEPIEEAMQAVVNTEAGRQLRELRDGPHGDEGVVRVAGGYRSGESPGAGRTAGQASRGAPGASHARLTPELLRTAYRRSSENYPSKTYGE
jgi:hypothetical protein